MIDLEELEARLDAANTESGPWSLEPDKDETVGLWIEALGDGGEPGEAAALFLRDIRETVLQLTIELRAGREAFAKLIKLHDEYDSDRDQYVVATRLFRILYDWDQPTVALKSGGPPADRGTSGTPT